jgi:hypothetical protein
MDLVVDPVCLSLVQGLDDSIDVSASPLTAVILQQLNHIAVLEEATDPVFLVSVLEDPIALKDPVSELADIEVPIFEDFLTHTVELRVHVVASFDNPKLEFILLPVSVGVVSSLTPSKDKLEA